MGMIEPFLEWNHFYCRLNTRLIPHMLSYQLHWVFFFLKSDLALQTYTIIVDLISKIN